MWIIINVTLKLLLNLRQSLDSTYIAGGLRYKECVKVPITVFFLCTKATKKQWMKRIVSFQKHMHADSLRPLGHCCSWWLRRTFSVMFLSSVSSSTACSLRLISSERSRVRPLSAGWEVYREAIMPPLRLRWALLKSEASEDSAPDSSLST